MGKSRIERLEDLMLALADPTRLRLLSMMRRQEVCVCYFTAVIDAPLEKGHVVLFANNPIYRGETIGSYFLVFNTIMNFDNLNAGRHLDAK